jgi:Tfp pilus assembly protein PilZ
MGERDIHGTSLNLSASGLLLETGEELQVGETVGLSFFLPRDPNRLQVHGQVVRQAPAGQGLYSYAMRFLGATRDERERIESFVHFTRSGGTGRGG